MFSNPQPHRNFDNKYFQKNDTMTQEQEKTLKKYERQITTAYFANYYVGIAHSDIRQINSLHNELIPHQREQFTTCNACVLKLLKKLYKYLELTKEEAENVATETEPINEDVNEDVNEYVNEYVNEAEKTDNTEEQQTAEAPKTKAKRQPRKTSKKK